MLADVALSEIGLALAIIAVAYVSALVSWLFRRKPARLRALLLIGQCALLFAMPWAFPSQFVALKVLVTLACCAALPPKLVDIHVRPDYWHDKPLREWIIYLLIPFILVPRLQVSAPVGVAAGLRPAIRGFIEMALGGVILHLAFRYFDGEGRAHANSFWLEHAIKLFAAYLLVFDGAFVLATGVLRMSGRRTLDLSQWPIMAVTPADFWRRYNCEAGRLLREDVFYPLGGRRHPIAFTVVTFLINGLLHEYLALILIGRITGYQLLFFTLHGLATAATLRLRPDRLPGWARLTGNLVTILFLYFTSILFFATIDLFLPWYQ